MRYRITLTYLFTYLPNYLPTYLPTYFSGPGREIARLCVCVCESEFGQ